MIPTNTTVKGLITSLPVRATNISLEEQEKIKGGCRDRYRCWLRSGGPLFGRPDTSLGIVTIDRKYSSDVKAEAACYKFYRKKAIRMSTNSFKGIHSQWMSCDN